MRYLPKSPADRAAMLKAIGIRSVDELFSPIPAEFRLKRDLAVPRQMAESEIVDWFKQRATRKRRRLHQFSRRRGLLPLPAGGH